jgi:hypothetical protein
LLWVTPLTRHDAVAISRVSAAAGDRSWTRDARDELVGEAVGRARRAVG